VPFPNDVTAIALIGVGAGLNGDFALMCGIVAKPARTAIAYIRVGAGLNGDFALMCGMVAKPARTAIG
jgi:hypothetical protein